MTRKPTTTPRKAPGAPRKKRAKTSAPEKPASDAESSADPMEARAEAQAQNEEPEGSDDDDVVVGEIATDVSDDASSAFEPRVVEARASGRELNRYDPFTAYLSEVQRHPLLTPDEEHELAVRYQQTADVKSAARMVTANLRLVVKIAYEYRRAYRNLMDLIQEGNIGLMQAVKRYDPYRGVKLSSYAAWWIRAYILRFILNNWRLVKLGTTQAQRKLFFNLRKKRQELQAMGLDPTHAEIAKQLNVPENDVAEMDARLAASEKSLDAPVGDSDGRSIAKVDMMPTSTEGPESLMADGELQSLLKDKLADFRTTLVGQDQVLAIVDHRLVAEDPLTLQELGDKFGISRERVRQLEQRLTSRLRDYLRSEIGDAAELV